MIELPEATTIARQLTAELTGRRIAEATHGNATHKFAFRSDTEDAHAAVLAGQPVGASVPHGSNLFVDVGEEHRIVLGGGGERILLHGADAKLPKKYHLYLRFDDDTQLTVSVQGWGSVDVLTHDEIAAHQYYGRSDPSPVGEVFTKAYFLGLFDALGPEEKRSVKYFVISEPGVLGVGNGYLQDILLRARLHPRRRAVSLTHEERNGLFGAVREILSTAIERGGRDSERDVFNRPGGYARVLHSKMVGEPCPQCATSVEKIQFLGGACYVCPACQEL
jgi:formamidopyrimidine-DNA glycosylase